MDTNQIISIAITWGPLALMGILVLFGLIFGLLRGFRKSVVLMIHGCIAAIACFIVYKIIVDQPWLDSAVVDTANKVLAMTGGQTLQEMLGVSPTCAGLKDILIELIPKNMDMGEGLVLVIQDNGAYLATLVSLAYHIIIALIMFILYLPIIFILYIIYFIFYPERRRKRRIMRREDETGKPYKKRRLLGGLVGFVRSTVVSLVFISFVGSLLFIIAGGDGTDHMNDVSFGDSTLDQSYAIYQSVSNYGESGIFSVLNKVKDKNNTPYYLYAADLVLQGGLDDPERDIKSTIYFRDEIGAYTGFARKTFALLMKYDTDNKIKNIIKGNADENIQEAMMEVFAKPGFSEDFSKLIDDFEAKTYFVNFSLSLIDSVVKHIEDLKFSESLDETSLKIIKIFFVDEGCIKVSDILSSSDAKALCNTLIGLLANQYTTEEKDEVLTALYYAEGVVDNIVNISLFNDPDKVARVNPLLANLYKFISDTQFGNNNQTTELSLEQTLDMADVNVDGVDWISEIKALLSASKNAIHIYQNIYDKDNVIGSESFDAFKLFDGMFSGEKAEENENAFDAITNSVSNSRLLGAVLGSSQITKSINEALNSIAAGTEIPTNIAYTNQIADDGTVTKYGDTYYLLKTVKLLVKNDGIKVIQNLTSEGEKTTSDYISAIKDFATILETKTDDNQNNPNETIIDVLINSELLSYSVTGILKNIKIQNGSMDITLYISDDVLTVGTVEKTESGDKNFYKLKTAELKNLFSQIGTLLDIIEPVVTAEEPDYFDLISDTRISDVIQSSLIIEGTISKVLMDTLADYDTVVIPKNMKNNVELWLSVNNPDGTKTNGEIVTLIKAIQDTGIDIKVFAQSYETDDARLDAIKKAISDYVKSDEFANAGELFDSKVLTYTLSNFISTTKINEMTIYVPEGVKEILVDDTTDYLINKDEFIKVLELLPDMLDLVDELSGDVVDYAAIINKKNADEEYIVDKLLDSEIIEGTIAKIVADLLADSDVIVIPNMLKNDDGTTSPEKWISLGELGHITKAMHDLNLDINKLTSSSVTASELIDMLDTDKIDSALDSKVLIYTITKQITTFDMSGIEVIVPDASFDEIVEGEDIACLKKTEIKGLIHNISSLVKHEEGETEDINLYLKNVVKNKDDLLSNDIILASIVYYLINNLPDGTKDIIIISDELKEAGSKANLKVLAETNVWRTEALAVIDALDVLLNISTDDELNLSDSDSILTKIKSAINDLNKPNSEGDEETKLDICYKSEVIRASLTKQLDDALKDLVSAGTLNNAHDIELSYNIDGVSQTAFKKSELKSLVDTVNELDLDLSNLDFEDIINNVKTFNDYSEHDTSKTKLEVAYGSSIIKEVITTKLDEALDNNNLVSDEVKDSVKVDGVYKQAEIAALINAVNELNIDMSSMDVSAVMDDVKNLNNTSEIITTKTRLEVLYDSILIQNILTDKIDEALTNDEDTGVVKKSVVAKVKTEGVYNIDEIAALINATNELNIDMSNVDISGVMDQVKDLNNQSTIDTTKTRLGVLYTSVIIQNILADKIDEALTNDTDTGVVKKSVAASVKTDGVYNFDEVAALIDATNELNIDMSSVDVSGVMDQAKDLNNLSTNYPTKTRLEVLYTSIIVQNILTTKLDESFDNNSLVSDAVKNSVKTDGIYNQSEIANLIYAVNELNIDTATMDVSSVMNEFSSLNSMSSIKASKTRLEVLYDSVLVQNILSDKIDEALTNDTDTGVVKKSVTESVKTGEVYNIEEVSALINASNELNIDMSSVDISGVMSEVNNLNDTSSIDPTNTRLGVLYTSVIIKNILTTKLDEVLDDNNLVTDTVKDSVKTDDGVYKQSEIENLIYAVNELNVDMATMDVSNIMNEFEHLNNQSTIKTSETRLEVLYDSVLVQNILTDKLDEALTNDTDTGIVKKSVTESVKTDNIYDIEEVSALIDATNELNLDMANVDVSGVAGQVKDLNNQSTIDTTKTRLGVLYTSVITQNILSKELDDHLTSKAPAKQVADSKDGDVYKQTEVAALIDVLNVLELDVSTFTVNNVKSLATSLNEPKELGSSETKLDVLYHSLLITGILTGQLDGSLSSIITASVLANSKTIDATSLYDGLYEKEDVKALIDAINALGVDIDSMDSIDYDALVVELNNAAPATTETKLHVAYKSYIVRDLISTNIHSMLESNVAVNNPTDAKEFIVKYETSFYIENELATLVDFVNINLGCQPISSFDVDSITINAAFISSVMSSKILYSTTSKNIVTNTSIRVPKTATEVVASETRVTEDEMLVILNSLKGSKISDEVSIDINSGMIANVYVSEVLNATASKLVLNNSVVTVPMDDTQHVDNYLDEDIIIVLPLALKQFLTSAMNGLGLTSVNGINASSIKLPTAENEDNLIGNSTIMRATITSSIKSDHSSLYVEANASYVAMTKNYKNQDIIIYTVAELKALFAAIRIISTGDDLSIDLDYVRLLSMESDDKETLVSSNTVKNLIADILNSYNSTMFAYDTTMDAYCVTSFNGLLNGVDTMTVATVKSHLGI